MRRACSSLALLFAGGAIATGLSGPAVQAQAPASPAPLRVLITGGGPNLTHNQVAIESNVRYVGRLLPSGATTRILFADGDPKTKDVLCQDNKQSYYRTPWLPGIDGATQLMPFQYNLDTLVPYDDTSKTPLLLYFTGHGSPEGGNKFDNNKYDMWGNEELTVKQLASELEGISSAQPVTVIMVQCFSGAFGNLLFKGGNPEGALVDRDICGFFASVPTRTAAGCTPEINEANYRDFTSYFFAALSGVDRLGNKVKRPDYNYDGKVGMNEAFAWSLINDESIDTPVCTSDVFLRRFVKTTDEEIGRMSYGDIERWSSRAQRAALDGLTHYLNYRGDDRIGKAQTFLKETKINQNDPKYVHTLRFVRLIKSVALAHVLETTGEPAIKARYARLLESEAGSPIHEFQGSREIFRQTGPNL